MNDDLVAKNFACYEMNTKSHSSVENQSEKTSLSLESVSDKISPAHVLWPTLLQTRKPKAFEMCEYDRSVSEIVLAYFFLSFCFFCVMSIVLPPGVLQVGCLHIFSSTQG